MTHAVGTRTSVRGNMRVYLAIKKQIDTLRYLGIKLGKTWFIHIYFKGGYLLWQLKSGC